MPWNQCGFGLAVFGAAGVVLWRGTGLFFGVYETHPFGLFREL